MKATLRDSFLGRLVGNINGCIQGPRNGPTKSIEGPISGTAMTIGNIEAFREAARDGPTIPVGNINGILRSKYSFLYLERWGILMVYLDKYSFLRGDRTNEENLLKYSFVWDVVVSHV